MEYEFSPKEINEITRVARVWAPGFTQEQLQELVNSQHQLADSGFCDAAWGMVRLEQEKDIHCTEALDACEHLLQDKAELEQSVGDLEARLKTLKGEIREAQDRQREVEEATERAKGGLLAVQAERQKEEKGLAAFKKRAEKEKQRIDKGLEKYRQEASVSREEITGASQLKKQLESYGFSVKLALDLSQEFAGRESAKEALGKAIEEHGTLTKSNAALVEQGKAQKKALESELNRLKSEKDGGQAEINNLEQARHQLENILSQLQADVAHEEELRKFYHRYQSAGWLMEYLAGWREIYFVRCNNPVYALTGAFDQRAGGAHFCTEKPPIRRCPCCDYPDAVYDLKFYRTFNLNPGTPVKVELGE